MKRVTRREISAPPVSRCKIQTTSRHVYLAPSGPHQKKNSFSDPKTELGSSASALPLPDSGKAWMQNIRAAVVSISDFISALSGYLNSTN